MIRGIKLCMLEDHVSKVTLIKMTLDQPALNVHVAERSINRRDQIVDWLLRCKDAEIDTGVQCHVWTWWV